MTRSTRLALGAFALALAACSKSYRVGDHVMVQWETGPNQPDYPAKIIAVESPTKYRVHFDCCDSIWDESVPQARIKSKVSEPPPPSPPPPAKVRARLAAGNKVSMSTFKAGDKVKVMWKGTYYPSTILMALGGEFYRVHYDGYDSNWDEDVDGTKIQRK